tara:strand:- start:526 stop:741 length:216 start_codon:yes stop_codon:yes gene_type:complete
MKRFNCTSFDKQGVGGKCMEQSGKGIYVRYCDAKKEIAELKKEIAKLEKAVFHFNKTHATKIFRQTIKNIN